MHKIADFEMLVLDDSAILHGIKKGDSIYGITFDIARAKNGGFVIFSRDGSEHAELGIITFLGDVYTITDMNHRRVDMGHSSIIGIAVSMVRNIASDPAKTA
ncbi:hypothetical protein SAMN04515656_101213 [Eubacterium aggregans]|uniref:Peptidase S24/S26A/S26B/S26C domain-containing protein n=1 Tax=Eubacterium aggregans TaxID=81409 RepID=A0A1H3X3L1_9FIRM|nr:MULTISPECIES: hypothetical protein [Clostridia]MEA5004308.1 hypothetical protein [Christensenella sp.]SDZ93977.1 hypothetical protein SAMN04515656_101213 [Eubacterium aggregans]